MEYLDPNNFNPVLALLAEKHSYTRTNTVIVVINHKKWTFPLKVSLQNVKSSHRRCSLQKGILRNFAKLTGKHLCQSLFFNKVAILLKKKPELYLKRDSGTGFFLWIMQNFWEHLSYRTPPDDCFWIYSTVNNEVNKNFEWSYFHWKQTKTNFPRKFPRFANKLRNSWKLIHKKIIFAKTIFLEN